VRDLETIESELPLIAAVLPPATRAAPELAWSVDDTDDDVDSEPQDTDDRQRFPRPVMAALVVLVGTVGAAVITLGAMYFTQITTKPIVPSSVPLPPPCTPKTLGVETCLPASSPEPTVTATAAPPAPPVVTPGLSAYDQNFLSLMSQEGWGCTDNSDAEQCRKQMVSFAHQICSYSGQPIDLIYQNFGQPIDLIYQNFGLPSFLGPREERRAIANAEQAYPNCTFTGSP
jgi:hypothetical protein